MLFELLLIVLLSPILFWLVTFVYTAKRGSPYVPIKPERLKDITKYIKKGDFVADLGCGDGRVLAEAINRGAKQAEGWELDALVYSFAQKYLAKLTKKDRQKIKVHFGDFWHADLSKFDVIYVYQMTKHLKPFQEKLLPQLKKGALIISPDYQIPGMEYWKQENKIFVYKI